MCSTPPASTMSHAPSAISPAPVVTAVSAPAHMRSSAKPGTDCGMPASSATSRPSVSPWSPTCAVAAKITSPIRSAGICGLRRSSSRTTLTAMSSARVFQNIPFGPARPNAVRTPSTKTTSRSSRAMPMSLRRCLLVLFQLTPEVLELPAIRDERLAVELDHDRAARRHELAVTASVEQAAVRVEAVAGRVNGLRGLGVVARVVERVGEIRQVRDDEIGSTWNGLEQIALDDVHAGGDAVTAGGFARGGGGLGGLFGNPGLPLRGSEPRGDRGGERERTPPKSQPQP